MNPMLANENAVAANTPDSPGVNPAPHAPPAGSPLQGDLRNAAWAFCRELAAVCADKDADYGSGNSVARGRTGGALYLAAWHRATGDAQSRSDALALAQTALETLGDEYLRFDWVGGLAGATWALRRLGALDQDEPLDPAFSEEIDQALASRLAVETWVDDYDLISGLVGDGLYALDHPDRRWRELLVGEVLRHLAATATTNDAGITWFTRPELLPEHQREIYQDGYHNLGLAHGVPGVVGFLARCVAEDCHAATARPLLEGSMRWLVAQSLQLPGRQPATNEKGYFASFAESNRPSRLAWCYGDLGVCVALLRAAEALGHDDWHAFALEVARDCASRSVDESLVNDMGMCHGAAGAALVFLRLWQRTGDPSLAEAVRFWVQRTLDMRLPQFPATAGVFSMEWEDGVYYPISCVTYFTGAAGVGLALLSSLTGDTDSWDAMFLTDLPREAQA